MATIEVGPNTGPIKYQDQQHYVMNGGVLNLDTNAGLLGFGKTSNATAEVGADGGTINIDLDSSIFSGLSGDYEYTINMANIPPENLMITYSLNGPKAKGVVSYDGSRTTFSLKVTGGIFPFTSSITVYIVVPGNSNGLAKGQSYTFATSSGSGQINILCYAEGTFIKTPTGQKRIETLSVNDHVCVMIDNREVARPIKWIGKREITIIRDEDRLIRIRRDALGSRVPFDDLLVTPEHSIVMQNRLIPSRMLVNNTTIIQDPAETFTVYHLALEHHGVLVANGAFSESYLDTGNRSLLEKNGKPSIAISRPRRKWQQDAALELCTDREFVEPVYRSLQARAGALGFASDSRPSPTFSDPDVTLLTDSGSYIKPRRQNQQHYVFPIDSQTSRVWICSRHSRPSDLIGPFMDDRRDLGVLVSGVILFTAEGMIDLTDYRTDPLLLGRHDSDHLTHRWTDGQAELPLGDCDLNQPALLVIDVIQCGPYACDDLENSEGEGFRAPLSKKTDITVGA